MKNKAVIYARVSGTGDRRSTDRQVADLTAYAAAAGLEVVRIFEEKAGGAKEEGKLLAECMEFLKDGGAGVFLVSELPCLGRSIRQVITAVDNLTKAGINIYFQDHRLNTLKEDGTPDPVITLLISLVRTLAEMEREQISCRLNNGRRRAIENGVKMGRKVGYRLSDKEILGKYPEVARRLKNGDRIRDIATQCSVSTKTVLKVKKALYPQSLNKKQLNIT